MPVLRGRLEAKTPRGRIEASVVIEVRGRALLRANGVAVEARVSEGAGYVELRGVLSLDQLVRLLPVALEAAKLGLRGSVSIYGVRLRLERRWPG